MIENDPAGIGFPENGGDNDAVFSHNNSGMKHMRWFNKRYKTQFYASLYCIAILFSKNSYIISFYHKT